jgi:hypothetical protein
MGAKLAGLVIQGPATQQFVAAYLEGSVYPPFATRLRAAWRRLTDQDVLMNQLVFFTFFKEQVAPSDDLLSEITFASRDADEGERRDGSVLVDSTRWRGNHPCIGLLQTDPRDPRLGDSSDLFFCEIVHPCKRFIPRIANDYPEAARRLCRAFAARNDLDYFRLTVPFLFLCPAEFAARFVHSSDDERLRKLVSGTKNGLEMMRKSERLVLVKHILSLESLPEEIAALFCAICADEGSTAPLADTCALVSQLDAPRVKPATGGMIRK